MAITSPEISSSASNTTALVLPQATMHIPPNSKLHQGIPEKVKTNITITPMPQQFIQPTITNSSTITSINTSIAAQTPSPLEVQATITNTQQYFNLPIASTAPLVNTKSLHIPKTKIINRPKGLARFLDQLFVEPESKAKSALKTSIKLIMSPECRLDGILAVIETSTKLQMREVNRQWEALEARLSRWDQRSATGELKDADIHRFSYQLSDGYNGSLEALNNGDEQNEVSFMRECEEAESDAIVLSDGDLEAYVNMAGAQQRPRLRRMGRVEDLSAEYRVGL